MVVRNIHPSTITIIGVGVGIGVEEIVFSRNHDFEQKWLFDPDTDIDPDVGWALVIKESQ
jgi:hypothetical protein